MTLALAWLRTVGDVQELVMASDSRLRFGCAWDCCPKIVPLPRSDCAICFSGDTMYAYPLMMQMASTIESHPRSMNRSMDLCEMKGHSIRVFNNMRDHIHDLPQGHAEPEHPDTVFILGGYSWREERFFLWQLHFDSSIKRFTFRPASMWKGVRGPKLLMVIGNHAKEAKDKIRLLLKARRRLTVGGFDMEPFEVLRDLIRNGEHPEIGGPPQLVKVHKHMNTHIFPIFWPNKESGKISLLGRPLLDYERTQHLVLDPDTLEYEPTWQYVDN